MKKSIETWSVDDLWKSFPQIDFPEYQREPNLWSLTEKQRLIDSMVRQFDIAPLYLYRDGHGSVECVDGRQRIGTIMAFLGSNEGDDDSSFRFRILNEIYEEEPPNFESLEGKTFQEIQQLRDEGHDQAAEQFLSILLGYTLNIVMLSNSNRAEEFNLQFTRLNLGAIINSGEKLNAMVGDLREECFEGLGKHPFLRQTNIPTRRYAQEQVAAQILAQIFSQLESGTYTRIRHIDLQRQFKLKSRLDNSQRETIKRVSELLDLLAPSFREKNVLRNRAITVSTVLLAWNKGVRTQEDAERTASFIDEFVHRLGWQIKKGLFVDQEYHYLTNFQRNITQASAESSSVAARAEVLEREFARWEETNELTGDAEWKERNGGDPHAASRS